MVSVTDSHATSRLTMLCRGNYFRGFSSIFKSVLSIFPSWAVAVEIEKAEEHWGRHNISNLALQTDWSQGVPDDVTFKGIVNGL